MLGSLLMFDLAGDLPSTLMVERTNHCFSIEIVYENMCENCGSVGHTMDQCKHLSKETKSSYSEKAPGDRVRQEYRAKSNIQVEKSSSDIADHPNIAEFEKNAKSAKFTNNENAKIA
ncbi:hypothetical protein ACLB2K_037629 [Fragaria x ananassa]